LSGMASIVAGIPTLEDCRLENQILELRLRSKELDMMEIQNQHAVEITRLQTLQRASGRNIRSLEVTIEKQKQTIESLRKKIRPLSW